MKKLFLACLPLLGLAFPTEVQANYRLDLRGSLYFRLYCGNQAYGFGGSGTGLQAGPWYLYWPYEAHFANPAPTGYPNWPGAMTLPNGSPFMNFNPHAAPPAVHPQAQPAAPTRPMNYSVQPVGFSGEAPKYWYSR